MQKAHPSILESNATVRNSLEVYVPLRYGLQKPSDRSQDTFPLAELMEDIVLAKGPHGNARVVLLQGAAGTGKSLFGWRMMQYWDKDLDDNAKMQARMPFVVNLPTYRDEILQVLKDDKLERHILVMRKVLETCVLQALPAPSMAPEDLKQLRRCGKFVVVLDGVDELGLNESQRPFAIGRLCDLNAWPGSVFVMTSRTDFFSDDETMWKFCGPRNRDNTHQTSYPDPRVKQIHLMPFDAEQKVLYISSFAAACKNRYAWSTEQYALALASKQDMAQMMTTPLMMYLVLNILPGIASDNGKNEKRVDVFSLRVEANAKTTFTTVHCGEIYAIFTYNWIEDAAQRMGKLDADTGRPDERFLQQVMMLCRSIAFAMFMKDLTSFEFTRVATQLDDVDQAYRHSRTDDDILKLLDDSNDDLFRCSPLKRNGNKYSFLHKTVQEYFTATHIMHQLNELYVAKKGDTESDLRSLLCQGQAEQLLIGRRLVTAGDVIETLRFCADLVDKRVQSYILFGPVADVAANLFTQDAVHKEHDVEFNIMQPASRALWDIVQASRLRSPATRIAAGNALMVLTAAGMQFDGCNFDNIKLGIPGGPSPDVSGGIFSHCSFKQAALDGMRLDGCDFRGADLTNASLKNVSLGLLRMLLGHSDTVRSVCVTPDGKRIVSGSEDKTVRVWSLDKFEEICKLEGHSDAVSSVCVTPDGEHIISGSDDNTVRVWSLDTFQLICELEGHAYAVNSVCVTPDGKHIVSGSDDKTVRVWLLENFTKIRELEGHSDAVNAVCVTPDGKRIVSGSDDKSVRVWPLDTCEEIRKLKGHKDAVKSVCVTPDGKRIVSGSDDKTVRVWSLENVKKIPELEGHGDAVNSVCVTPDGKRIVSGSNDNTVRIWSLDSSEKTSILEGHSYAVNGVCVTPDGKRIVTGSDDNTVRVWPLHTLQGIRKAKGHNYLVMSVCITPDGRRIVSGSEDKTVRVWSLDKFEEIRKLEGHRDCVNSVCVTPDGKRIISGSDDKTVRVWSLDTFELICELEGHAYAVNSVCVTPDGKHIVSGSDDKTVRVWLLENFTKIRELEGHSDAVNAVCVTPDGKRIVSGSDDKSVRVWPLDTCQEIRKLKGHRACVNNVCVTPDGKHIVSASDDKTVRVWSLDTFMEIRKLEGHGDRVYSVCVTSDGKHIVSGSEDMTVRIWSLDIFEEIRKLEGHFDGVNSVCITLDSKRIVSGSDDNTVRVWSLDPSELCIPSAQGAITTDGNTVVVRVPGGRTLCVLGMTARLCFDGCRAEGINADQRTVMLMEQLGAQTRKVVKLSHSSHL